MHARLYHGLASAAMSSVLLLALLPSLALAQGDDVRQALKHVRGATTPPGIEDHATELGIAASFTTVSGATRGTVALRTGTFASGPQGMANAEFEVAYSRAPGSEVLDLGLALGALSRPGGGSMYPYANAAGAMRQEWSGGIKQVRWPVGFDIGVRFLTGRKALFRVEYRFRRVMKDPVADFDEHSVMCGISLLLRNDP